MSMSRDRSVVRRRFRTEIVAATLWLTFASLAAVSAVPQAAAQPNANAAAAQEFVRSDLDRGLSILNDHSSSELERRAKLRTYLNSFMDIPQIALFSLGVARRSATPDQIDRFVDVFREYAVAYFESLLTRYYSGQAMRITGASQDGPNSYRVFLVLDTAPSAGKGSGPVDLGVRVLNQNGRFVITDVAAAGIWFSLQQRDEINEYLLTTHGNFGGLIARYKAFTLRKQRQ